MTDTAALKRCPFCGGENLDIGNTHTASFWIECVDCGAQVSGEYFEGPHRQDFFCYSPEPINNFHANYDQLHPEYKNAFDSAVAAWNTRAALSEPAQDVGAVEEPDDREEYYVKYGLREEDLP